MIFIVKDSQGDVKKRKLKVKEILNLSCEECIIVDFDDDSAIGEAQGLLSGLCGILATDCSIFPIGFVKWNVY